MLYAALNVANLALWFVHFAIMALNIGGWAYAKTRRFSRWLLILTVLGWIVLGMFRGMGYCVLTDLQWRVREAMGISDNPSGFIHLLIRKLTGVLPSDALVTSLAVGGALIGVAGHIWIATRKPKMA